MKALRIKIGPKMGNVRYNLTTNGDIIVIDNVEEYEEITVG